MANARLRAVFMRGGTSKAVMFRQEYEATSGRSATDPATFFQQDTDSLERMSREFARTIVSAILEAF